jgi:hypothetical protein
LTAFVTTTGLLPLDAKRLRNTPNVRGYVLCWLVSVAVSPFLLGLALFAVADPTLEVLDPRHWPGWWLTIVPFAAIYALPFGLVLIPLLHFGCRELTAQRPQVIAFGVVTSLAYGVPFLFGVRPLEALIGLVPGVSVAVGRWAVSSERRRTW